MHMRLTPAKSKTKRRNSEQAAASGAPSFANPHRTARDRTTRLEQDLVTARRDLETQAALAAKASEEVARTRQTAERDSASLRSSLQQERARAEQLERDLALAKQVAPNAVTVGSIAREKPDGKREVSRRQGTSGGRSERCPAQFQESRGGGSVACACERAARAGRHRRGADCAGARRRDGQRPGKLLARRNL